ncbi:MAG: hypothetical protein PHD81_01525 [Candidatus Nanoarchaeia archaeon]|nr:hypothetical protein [Candidatus Nanoarchaeia archaeon]MDD5587768.1 hypothetical protein [Candidatus Nanoarchaeia archaeon]
MNELIYIPATLNYSSYPSKQFNCQENHVTLRFSAKYITDLDRFTSKNIGFLINFTKERNEWIINLCKVDYKLSNRGYYKVKSSHSQLQISVNKELPLELKKELEWKTKKGTSFSKVKRIIVKINLEEWKEIGLKPWHFLSGQEVLGESLMKYAINKGFSVNYIPKGRECDLQLIGPNNTLFAIALFSHNAKTERRSRDKRIQKLLGDVARLFTITYNSNLIPVVISQPYMSSRQISIQNYVDFYSNKFNFKFIITSFNKGWEQEVCKKLVEFDNNKVFK